MIWLAPVNDLALGHGPAVALACCLVVSPVGPACLALVLERRVVRPTTDYLAFLYGDCLLAAAVAVGASTAAAGGTCPLPAAWQHASLLAGIVAGCAQWRLELNTNAYSPAQAVSPTKIWHQLVVLPTYGSWLVATAAVLAPRPGTSDAYGALLALVLVTSWLLLVCVDQRNLKLGHPPFDWRALRPLGQPWDRSSRTLQTWQHAAGLETATRRGSGSDRLPRRIIRRMTTAVSRPPAGLG